MEERVKGCKEVRKEGECIESHEVEKEKHEGVVSIIEERRVGGITEIEEDGKEMGECLWVKMNGESKGLLTGFYGHPETAKRKGSWELLQMLKPSSELGWCVIGDFNELISQDEKWGRNERRESQMEEFRNALSLGGLSDLGWRDTKYTWSNGHSDGSFVKERLDRAVANQVWRWGYSRVEVETLVAWSSDHLNHPFPLSFPK
ncbi:uncharacterized protein LOC121236682 [Juglans microcarpa x Juglans regia]|uniref:uncharacterized protein LOC121236682 n=1 Tax=Juglans microcarpa x Juglans regia TaxID=2249226 RepID=UPI001B7E1175|nr:uncharacterized protein LOC121236682 [Juglans microcarpa x Juglans regia]